jgi:DNA-binding NarL/FixJ family response regulator
MHTGTPIRIFCVDDHPLMREGITAVINNEKYREHRPDVTLMDLRLPDLSGIDALIAIRAQDADARVIMLTTFEGDAEILRALEAGALGYMLKSMPRKQLVEMIRKVHAGKRLIPPEVAAYLAEHLGDETLSKREIEVLEKVAGGNRNCDIAALLFISEETVKGHIKHIMEKLGARDRTEAVTIATRRGIIHLS